MEHLLSAVHKMGQMSLSLGALSARIPQLATNAKQLHHAALGGTMN
jgi:hypothetical protein